MNKIVNQYRILLVEDDEALAELTADYLSGFSYDVSIEYDGLTAVDRILNENPDLVILDVMLPGKDGIDVCREVRSQYKGPILMLTARSDQVDQVLGLEIGADDYVCKPVEPRLLLARIKALFRRIEMMNDISKAGSCVDDGDLYSFGNVEIDNFARQVLVDGKLVELSNPEYDLLWYLATNAGNVLSRERIFETIRGISYDGTNRFVDVTISNLRSKIGDASGSLSRIQTVRGQGYMLVPD